MKRKTMTFNGLGFPVVLHNVHTVETSHGKALDIDYNALQSLAFEALIRKPARLSGAEVRFIRHHMLMSQTVFADFLGVERSAVAKWEAKDLAATGMAQPTELVLRIQMVRHLRRSVDRELSFIEPGVRKKSVGKPTVLAV